MDENEAERAETFDALFADNPDPWNFENSVYERDKRAATIAALQDARFSNALEIGCATGVLTRDLAAHSDALLALDVSEQALAIARSKSVTNDTVVYRRAEAPRDWPEGSFDLIVLSEVLYFLSAEEIAIVSRRAHETLAADGLCLLVNWTGPNDLLVGGEEAALLFSRSAPWRSEEPRIEASYRIDRLRR
ncbi:class I SAM-dependent DNA methyltransferase [Aurantiacibacter suaedae]|uniref:class I SAM-dependent DNA methyltransferase n=1 Tax=Aurantiacibacter suaedae TaxID=2545755 RepID=UPI0013868F4E|nr:SAM-dependent methyltransferase [Aurantiacibacter suaedae]